MMKINSKIARWGALGTLLVGGILGVATKYADGDKYFEIAKNLELFANTYKEVNTNYVDELEPAKLMRTAIDAMLGSLDPFTNYISEADITGYRLQATGSYGGVGIDAIDDGDNIVLTTPYEGFPAHKAGLEAGDIVLKVNGESVKGKKAKDVAEVFKGSAGGEIEVKVKRAATGEESTVKMIRAELHIPNVPYHGMIDDKTGYINLTTFSDRAGENVANALEELKKDPKLQQVILDLRGNGGGLLNEAVNVCNVFVNKGELISSTKGKVKEWDKDFKTLNNPIDIDIPLVVLIDHGSASASEIVSGVIQDLDRGVVMGQLSYGKGLVQNTADIGYNSKVKFTIAKYYIPSGRCIQAVSYYKGEPVRIPDSLRTAFKTRNGRTVYDGGGVNPDVEIHKDELSMVAKTLLEKNWIFHYATTYKSTHKEIPAAKDFNLSDADYQGFINFLKGKDYSYQSETDKALAALEEKTKKDKLDNALKQQMSALKQQIQIEKANDLQKNKAEIINLLEKEIAARYYLQKGKIQIGFKNDPEVKEAIRLLGDKTKMQTILAKK